MREEKGQGILRLIHMCFQIRQKGEERPGCGGDHLDGAGAVQSTGCVTRAKGALDNMRGCHKWSSHLGRPLETATGSTMFPHQGNLCMTPLPSPRKLHQWLGTEQTCNLCGTINASLQHILSGCNIALAQGQFRWRHDQALKKLAEVVENRRKEANSENPAEGQQRLHFLRAGDPSPNTNRRPLPTCLTPGSEWQMEVDCCRQFWDLL